MSSVNPSRGLSLRTKLTLWNVAGLGTLMVALTSAIIYDLRVTENNEIDRELSQRSEFFASFMRNPRWWPAPKAKPPSKTTASVHPPAPKPPPPKPSLSPDKEIERTQWFRTPRLIRIEDSRPIWDEKPMWDPAAAAKGLNGVRQFTIASSRGERVQVLTLPIYRDRALVGVLQTARELGDMDKQWAHRYRMVSLLLPIALLVAAAGGAFLTNRALGPIHMVTRMAGQIGETDLSRRLPVQGRDELAELCQTFNHMVERLEGAFDSRAQAYQKLEDAFEQQRRFTSDASHELRTPLARIKVATSAALQGPQTNSEYRAALEVADQASDAMKALIDQLLLLARADSGQFRLAAEIVDLNELIMDAGSLPCIVPSLQISASESPVWVKGDRQMLARVLSNLLENASRHTPATGTIEVACYAEGASAVLKVSDTGEGIAEHHLVHVFDRFYRADSSRSRAQGGTGLGLAIGKGIVEAHRGDIRIESQLNQGTTVYVKLPLITEDVPEMTPSLESPTVVSRV